MTIQTKKSKSITSFHLKNTYKINVRIFSGYLSTFFILFISIAIAAHTQPEISQKTFTYKTIDTLHLHLNIFYPSLARKNKMLPGIIFFFGGGWVQGTPAQFVPHCYFLAGKGLIAITAEYRVKNRNKTTPLDAIADAKSAIRWLKMHGVEVGIDTARIVAAGGSAGGHLAACTAFVTDFNDSTDNLNIDPKPSALILFNPVLNAVGFAELFGGKDTAMKASPEQFVGKNEPPTLIFNGTDDQIVPADSILGFQKKMQAAGNYCEVILFGGMKHAFFNKGRYNDIPFERTLTIMDQFLNQFGYLPVK